MVLGKDQLPSLRRHRGATSAKQDHAGIGIGDVDSATPRKITAVAVSAARIAQIRSLGDR
jgi:hypothetical protein